MKNFNLEPHVGAIEAVKAPLWPKKFYARRLKRATDLLLATLLLPIILPVIAVLAIAAKRDGGPAFFGHTRVGKDGKPFKCLKIRSMVPDAETKLKTYLAENPEENEIWLQEFKLRNDPRITKLGRLIRATSLDELPQIFNVLRGEMSFVGPRPVPAIELQEYGHSALYYKTVRPGITGLWQVSGRNDVSYPERVAMDRDYVRTLSFGGDIAIMLKTVMVILKKTGM